METKYLLEIVFKDGETARKHYPTAAAAAFVMDALEDWNTISIQSITLKAVKVVSTREMAGA